MLLLLLATALPLVRSERYLVQDDSPDEESGAEEALDDAADIAVSP